MAKIIQKGMFVNMKYLKACRNCLKGRPISLTGDVLCKYKGVVSADYVCIRHKFIPNLKTYRELNYKCIDCVNFCIERISGEHPHAEHVIGDRISYDIPQDNSSCSSSIGLCKLFSVRRFDGSKRSACSKFLPKPESRILMRAESRMQKLEQKSIEKLEPKLKAKEKASFERISANESLMNNNLIEKDLTEEKNSINILQFNRIGRKSGYFQY